MAKLVFDKDLFVKGLLTGLLNPKKARLVYNRVRLYTPGTHNEEMGKEYLARVEEKWGIAENGWGEYDAQYEARKADNTDVGSYISEALKEHYSKKDKVVGYKTRRIKLYQAGAQGTGKRR